MSNTLLLVILSVGGSTVLGVLDGLCIRQIPSRFNDAIFGFAAGVMLAAAVLGLLAPAFGQAGAANLVLAILGTLAGAGLISVLDRIVPHLHRLAGLDSEERRNNRSVAFSTVTTTFLDAHSSGESVKAIIAKASPQAVGVIVCALGAVLAIGGIVDRSVDFLYLIASVFAPMAAVLIVSHYFAQRSILSRGRISPKCAVWNLVQHRETMAGEPVF